MVHLFRSGNRYAVDADLSKFFDTVNHDLLMRCVAKRVKDKRVLKLIRKYLKAEIIADGLSVHPGRGVPQGGPLSPLLANILLDELDSAEGTGCTNVQQWSEAERQRTRKTGT